MFMMTINEKSVSGNIGKPLYDGNTVVIIDEFHIT